MPSLDDLARAGIQAVNDGKIDEAIDAFTKALAMEDRPDLNNALGMAYLHRGEVGSALPHLAKAVEQAKVFDGEDHQAMRQHFVGGLATAYELADQVQSAVACLDEAAATWPDAVELRLQRAQLLLASCRLEEGLQAYSALVDDGLIDGEKAEAAQAIVDSARAFVESEEEAGVFLQAHSEAYIGYFDEVSGEQVRNGWYAEAARMKRGPDGNPVPFLAEGARPYAMSRVDLVNPADGSVAGIYSEQEPMVVALDGAEPLAQMPVFLPWRAWPFEVHVCTQVPWHWLFITVQLEQPIDKAAFEVIDEAIGDWYLAGYNGEFGERDRGRFHYISDPEPMGDRGVSYVIDLGRASYDAIGALLRRLVILNDRRPITRVLFGRGHLPDV